MAGGCSAATGPRPVGDQRPPAASLLYLKGSRLRRFDLRTGADRPVARLPSADARPAPEGTLVATVVDASLAPPGEEDFAARPHVVLVDSRTGHRHALGPGVAPLWNEAGTRLAWLRPDEERSCSGEVCTGRVAVDSLELESMRSRTLMPPGRWSLLGWAGGALLAADIDEPSHVVAATAEGRVERVAVRPSEVWGASPDGDWLLLVRRRSVALAPLSAGLVTGRPRTVARGAHALADGSWGPGGGRLAVVDLRRRGGGLLTSRIVLLSVRTGSLEPLAGSEGATGSVLWSPDGEEIAFARPAGRNGGRLEAVICGLDARRCRSLFSWVKDVTLVRLEAAPDPA